MAAMRCPPPPGDPPQRGFQHIQGQRRLIASALDHLLAQPSLILVDKVGYRGQPLLPNVAPMTAMKMMGVREDQHPLAAVLRRQLDLLASLPRSVEACESVCPLRPRSSGSMSSSTPRVHA